MRLDDEQESSNFEVQDGRGGGFGGGGGMGGLGLLLPLIGSRFGCGGIVVVLIILAVMGVNPLSLMSGGGGVQQAPQSAPAGSQDASKLTEIQHWSLKVLGSTERVWGQIFKESGQTYTPTVLSFYAQSGTSGCGAAQSAMGPFYCPADQKVYIDLDFFDVMRKRLGAPGDFAQAYVIAHEVGHHVQNLMGITDQMEKARARVSEREYNALSVRLELQADCFAGIWAHHNHKTGAVIEPGDVEEALNAAAAIGDDALQRKSQGQVIPDSFTHGTSAQRQRWFDTGLKTGSVQACDTFKAQTL